MRTTYSELRKIYVSHINSNHLVILKFLKTSYKFAYWNCCVIADNDEPVRLWSEKLKGQGHDQTKYR